mmetsp:Transcript_14998/g.22842  ORF Transcript_14998/g.22842 Transcript_14998/m.22842 type:complete len:85 (-) Transcript_14998:56-310(-)
MHRHRRPVTKKKTAALAALNAVARRKSPMAHSESKVRETYTNTHTHTHANIHTVDMHATATTQQKELDGFCFLLVSMDFFCFGD